MIVLDASLVVELLIGRNDFGLQLRQTLKDEAQDVVVPYLLDLEVLSVLRKLSSMDQIDSTRIKDYLSKLATMAVERYPHEPLLPRIWELRHNFTVYDASYIALAEATKATLYTTDAKLLKGHRAKVVYLGGWVI